MPGIAESLEMRLASPARGNSVTLANAMACRSVTRIPIRQSKNASKWNRARAHEKGRKTRSSRRRRGANKSVDGKTRDRAGGRRKVRTRSVFRDLVDNASRDRRRAVTESVTTRDDSM